MSQRMLGPKKAFTAGGALPEHARVKLSAGVLALAGLADGAVEIGQVEVDVFAANEFPAVLLANAEGTRIGIAAKAIAVGDIVYTAASGKYSDVNAAGASQRGIALTAAAADGDWFEFLPSQGTPSATVPLGGQYTATAGDATANAISIDTGLSNVDFYQIQIFRAGALVASDQIFSETDGVLAVAEDSTYSVTAGDVVHWVAFGQV